MTRILDDLLSDGHGRSICPRDILEFDLDRRVMSQRDPLTVGNRAGDGRDGGCQGVANPGVVQAVRPSNPLSVPTISQILPSASDET